MGHDAHDLVEMTHYFERMKCSRRRTLPCHTDTGSCTCNIAILIVIQRAPHSHDEYAAVEPVVDAIGHDNDIALVRGGFVRAAAAAVPAAGELVSGDRGEQ